MIQFPEKFQERMQQMLGDEEYAEFLKSYDLPFHNGLRINTWKIKPQELLQRILRIRSNFQNILIIREVFIIFRRPAPCCRQSL